MAPHFTFEHLKLRLEELLEHTANRNVSQIELHDRLLAEDLKNYSRPIQPTYKDGTRTLPPVEINPGAGMCRDMARELRAAARYCEQPDTAAQYVQKTIEIFESSAFYPKS